MIAWLVKLMKAVLADDDIQGLLSKLISQAVDQANADVLAELSKLEQAFVHNLEQLPVEILGDLTTTVKSLLNAEDLAKAIVGQMSGDGRKPPWWPF